VTDAFGGGIVSAIDTYVSLSGQHEHYLLSSAPKFSQNDDELLKKFIMCNFNLSSSLFFGPWNIYTMYRRIKPDYVHLHSSYAGVYGRICGIPSKKIIYTPHGYACQRKDVEIFSRKLFFMVEWGLAKLSRHALVAACGPGEYDLALKISKKSLLVSNCANVNHKSCWIKHDRKEKIVCMIGRICIQKGVDLFLETYQEVIKKTDVNYRFIWIGDGDIQLKSKLLQGGIKVTGWKSNEEVENMLLEADAYFHTALWDGLPISLLEASKIGIPLIVFDTEATSFLGSYTVQNTDDAVEKVILACEVKWNKKINDLLNTKFSKENLVKALKKIYKT